MLCPFLDPKQNGSSSSPSMAHVCILAASNLASGGSQHLCSAPQCDCSAVDLLQTQIPALPHHPMGSSLLGEADDAPQEPRTSMMRQGCMKPQRPYMNEQVRFSNLGQEQLAQPNFFSLMLFIQPKGFSDDLRQLPSWVSVHLTRSPVWQKDFIISTLVLLPPLHAAFPGPWLSPSPPQTSLFQHAGT